MSNKLLPTIAIIISMIIWSISGIAIKHALVSLPPLTYDSRGAVVHLAATQSDLRSHPLARARHAE